MHSFFPIVTIYNKKRRLNNFLFHRLHWTTKIVSVVFYLSRWISLFFLLPWIVTGGSFYMCWKVEKIKIDTRSTENTPKCCCDLSLMTWALDVGIWNQLVCPDGASLSGLGHSLFGWLFVVSYCIQTVHNHETIVYDNLWECLIGRLRERYARFKQKLTVNVRTECELWKDFVKRLIVSSIWIMYEYNVFLL